MRVLTILTLSGLLLSAICLAGEDNGPGPENPRPKGWRRAEGNPDGGAGRKPALQADMFAQALARNGGVPGIVYRMLGIDLEDGANKITLDDLPLGANRRMVLNVPVGGIEVPGGSGAGWKMENVFTLSAGQQNKLQALREAYQADKKALEKDLAAQEQAFAEKAAKLRQKYENRANDLLADSDKALKQKLDAIGQEAQRKIAAAIADALKLFDPEDLTQGMALLRMLRDKSTDIAQESEDKILSVVPAESRERLAEAMRDAATARQALDNFLQARFKKLRKDEPAPAAPAPPAPPREVKGF